MAGTLQKWWGWGGGRVRNMKIVQEKLSKQNSWKEKPKEKRNFPHDGSYFDIKSVLNIISASGIRKKLMNTFYMLQEKF